MHRLQRRICPNQKGIFSECGQQVSLKLSKLSKITQSETICYGKWACLILKNVMNIKPHHDSPDVDVGPVHEEDGSVVVHVQKGELAPLLS
jgi:hypothetical protein